MGEAKTPTELPLSPEREAEIRAWLHKREGDTIASGAYLTTIKDLAAANGLLRELDRMRAALEASERRVAELSTLRLAAKRLSDAIGFVRFGHLEPLYDDDQDAVEEACAAEHELRFLIYPEPQQALDATNDTSGDGRGGDGD